MKNEGPTSRVLYRTSTFCDSQERLTGPNHEGGKLEFATVPHFPNIPFTYALGRKTRAKATAKARAKPRAKPRAKRSKARMTQREAKAKAKERNIKGSKAKQSKAKEGPKGAKQSKAEESKAKQSTGKES